MDKYNEAIARSEVSTDSTLINSRIAEILDKHLEENRRPEVMRQLFNDIDLTSLHSTDTQASVAELTEKVNAFDESHPDLPSVASICVYPNLVPVVRTVLDVSSVHIAAVAGGFPSGQTFIEVKVAEIALAVAAGADEIDVVFPLSDFLGHDYEEVADQIEEMKHACRQAPLKVILETGALGSPERIRNAAILALYSGADFLKTSTGKEYTGADLEAAYVICQAIKEYYAKTGRMVGFKVSGGVTTADEALRYYTLVKEILGEKWLETNEYFRIGASRLTDSILAELTPAGEEPIKL